MAASAHVLKELMKGIDFCGDNNVVVFDLLPNKHFGWAMFCHIFQVKTLAAGVYQEKRPFV